VEISVKYADRESGRVCAVNQVRAIV
jgi:hypothetical protein